MKNKNPAFKKVNNLSGIIKKSFFIFVIIFFIFGFNLKQTEAAIAVRNAVGSNNAGGATTITMTMPTNVNGDVLIMSISYNSTSYAPVLPSGWTQLLNGTGGNQTFWKIASNEPASFVVTFGGSLKASGTIISLSGAVTSQPASTQYSIKTNTSSTTISAAALGTFSISNGIDLFFGGTKVGTTAAAPTSYTLAAQSASTGGNASTRTTSGISYRTLTGVTTVGALTAVYGAAAVNEGHHIFIKEYTPATCTSQVVTGNWNTAGTWNCGHVPSNTDSVIIRSGDTITMDVNSNLLNAITINGVLTTSGSNYSLTGATLNIASTGTLTANGSTINLTGTSGTLFTKNAAGTFNAGIGTVTLSGNGSATINSGDITFSDLTSSGTGTKTLGGNITVSDVLTVSAGTFDPSTLSMTVNSATSITGILNDSSATGTNIFVGAVTVNSGGTWGTNIANSAYTFRGGLTVNSTSTFTSGSGVYTFDTNAQTVAGTQTYTIINLTNNITTGTGLTFSGTTATVTTLTQGTNADLTFSGTVPTITTLTATASGNTVAYSSSTTQTGKVTTYMNLTIGGTSAKTFATTPTVNGILSMEGTATIVMTTGVVTYGSSATLQYNTASAMTTSIEEWITPFIATGGIIIANTGVITLDGAKQLGNNTNVPLTINTGATLTPGTNLITLHGDLNNSGNLITSGAGGIIIGGTVTTQSIAGFTTNGTISMTKTSGTATFTGNVSGGALTINGSGGTLDLGTGKTHTFTNITLTNGTLTANNSTINLTGETGTLLTKTSGTFNAGTGTVNISSNSVWKDQINSCCKAGAWYGITSSSDGTKLAGVVFGDYVSTSADSGVNWTVQTGSGQNSFESITSSSDGTKLAAGVYAGNIYTSINSGVTWTAQTKSGSRYWYTIASSSDGTKLIAADNGDGVGGYIYTSADSGATWTQQTAAGSHNWSSVASSSDGTKLVALERGGYIYTSINSGANWTQQTAAGSHTWVSVASSSDGTKLVAGGAGSYGTDYIYTSIDSGANWTQQTAAGSHNWSSVTSSSDGTKLAAIVYSGNTYTSINSGVTWTQTSSGSFDYITSSSDGTKLAAVHRSGDFYTYQIVDAIIASGSPAFYNLTISGSGRKSIGENLTVTNALTISDATLDTSTTNYTVNANSIAVNGGELKGNASTINLTGTGTVFNYTSGTITPGTSTIKLTDTSATAKTFAGGGQTYNNIWITGAGTGTYTISGSNTFNDFKVDTQPKTVLFTAGTTQTVSSLTANGTAGNLITLKSTLDGSFWEISKASGSVISTYLSLRDSHAIGGAIFNAGVTSVNVSGNTGWVFGAIVLPTVTTQAVTSITLTTATGNGNITVTGGAVNDLRGVVYDLATQTYPGNVAPASSGYALKVEESGSFATGAFTESITGLANGTTYYTRAYSHNSAGYYYGSEVSFTTLVAQAAPTIVPNTADLMTTSDTTPTLEMTATDVNTDDVEYNVQISADSGFAASEKWVATGTSAGTNTLAHSSNGIDWTGDGKSLFTGNGNMIAYNGSMWVATGVGTNSIAYSYNGIDWTGVTGTTIFTTGAAVAWNGTMWIVGGQGANTLAYSYNGIDWTAVPGSNSIFSGIAYGIAWNGSMWVAVGQGTNSIAYSSNGTSWTGVTGSTTLFSSYGRGVAWNGSIWVAGGVGTNTLAHSSNGTSWTGDGVGLFSSSVVSIAWDGSKFVATGNDTTKNFAYSSNGTSWTPVTGKTIFSNFVRGIAWNGNKFVATGDGTNTLAYSSNGIAWTGLGLSTFASGSLVASNSPVGMFPSISAPSSFDKVSTTDAGFLNTVTGGDTHPFNSGEKASYTVQVSDALALGTYYWRVRAIDPLGTNTYSSWTTTRSFTITAAAILPTVTTQAVSSITATTATGNGNITVTGGENNDLRGVVYDTATYADPGNVAPASSAYTLKVEESGSFPTGAFTENITGLVDGTIYYVRAYSHNSAGYSYGNEVSFTASATGLKQISGTLISSVFDTTAPPAGVSYNSIMWKGTLGAGNTGKVRFQLGASSSIAGPWSYYGGITCGALDWFDALTPSVPVELKGTGMNAATCRTAWNNQRYFRYKVQICSNDCVTAGASTPVVNKVVVNWSS